jgi:ABC-type sugar transport system substrate-binding protein
MMKVKTVSMLVMDNDFGQSLAKGFTEYASKTGVKTLSGTSSKWERRNFLRF